MSTPLSPTEQAQYDYHMAVIKQSFITMIKSLAYIHRHKLYRGDGGRTWAQFCHEDLQFSTRMGYLFVEAFAVLEHIETYNEDNPTPVPLPSNLYQMTNLAKLDEDYIIPVWQMVNATDDKVTGTTIGAIAHALKSHGVTDVRVVQAIADLSQTDSGRGVVDELLTTGFLQFGDSDEAIPLADVRHADLVRFEGQRRRERIMQRVADEGGMPVTIYPNNPAKTAKALLSVMSASQVVNLADLLTELVSLDSVKTA